MRSVPGGYNAGLLPLRNNGSQAMHVCARVCKDHPYAMPNSCQCIVEGARCKRTGVFGRVANAGEWASRAAIFPYSQLTLLR